MNNFTFLSDTVTQILFNDFSIRLPYANQKPEHEVIGDFIGGIYRTPMEHHLVIHFSPFYFCFRKPLEQFCIFFEDFIAAITHRQSNGGGPVFINLLDDVNQYVSHSEFLCMKKALFSFNEKLCDLGANYENIFILSNQDIFAKYALNDVLSYENYDILGMPYNVSLASEVANSYYHSISGIYTIKKKVLVVDADNTLWQGVIGEDGVEGVKIGGEYPGSIFADFQRQLLRYKQAGLLLCLCTKNNSADIEDAFSQRDMPLSLNDFVVTKTNWERKSTNILEIVDELNLGLESVIFVDDNPFEIDEVSGCLEGVTCLQFDYKNKKESVSLLDKRLDLFRDHTTDEDTSKTEIYKAEKLRNEVKTYYKSENEFQNSLNLEIEYFVNNSVHVKRASQMSMKTNQFNLTAKRYSISDISLFMKNHKVITVCVSDKYGDMGVVGLAILIDNEIDTFLMSCRAFGRKIENTIFSICEKETPSGKMFASYIPTFKNALVEKFFDGRGMQIYDNDGRIAKYVKET